MPVVHFTPTKNRPAISMTREGLTMCQSIWYGAMMESLQVCEDGALIDRVWAWLDAHFDMAERTYQGFGEFTPHPFF